MTFTLCPLFHTGPNGAGKSTTLNVLTGFLTPTSGTATVQGHDIRSEMDKIYGVMGVCPQDNLLWPRLTAREHLLFYGRLKNLKGDGLHAAVQSGLRSVNLWNGGVADKEVRTFSGGMKRRLQVAISLIGNPLGTT
jgi:ABC-type multidrug transport system ATPase subunit